MRRRWRFDRTTPGPNILNLHTGSDEMPGGWQDGWVGQHLLAALAVERSLAATAAAGRAKRHRPFLLFTRLQRGEPNVHRTPFKMRLRAQTGEGMRSEGQRRRVKIPAGFTSTPSTVYRAARLPPSTAVYGTQPLDSVYHVYFVDDVYRLPPSTTVYHRLPPSTW